MINIKLSAVCADGWTMIPDTTMCLKYNTTLTSFSKAASLCKVDGADLYLPKSESENNFISKLVKVERLSVVPDIWLGASYIFEEGEWKNDRNESISFTNWISGKPNNDHLGFAENCAVVKLQENGLWRYQFCEPKSKNLSAICFIRGNKLLLLVYY